MMENVDKFGGEKWRPVLGASRYEISDMPRGRRLGRDANLRGSSVHAAPALAALTARRDVGDRAVEAGSLRNYGRSVIACCGG